MKNRIALALSLFFIFSAVGWAQAQKVRIESRVLVEVESLNESGEKTLIRVPTDLVTPGTIVIYVNRFTNEGVDTADGIVVTNPIPENMEYLSGSATENDVRLTFSIDNGKTYDAPENLKVTTSKGLVRPALAKDYTDIRWEILAPLPPGETGEVEYRAKLE